MKVSVNHIRKLNADGSWAGEPAPEGAEELIRRIGAQLAGVEETIQVGKRYEGVLVAKVVSCEDHPNADRLHVCNIDDGGKAEGVERDESGHVQVVCGAPNVRAGLTVAWLAPGTTVPDSVDSAEPFVLEARALRGVVSNGMLASPRELAIGDSHDGIMELDGDIAPGTLFAEAYNLTDDVVIDMENKMFTHRPDCFGVMGVAREIAGIQHQKFTSPAWYRYDYQLETPDGSAEGDLRVEVQNELPELVRRFVVLPMSNVTVKPSPAWLQIDLARLGIRPINNIVDLTNYYMVLTGQPLHAYDYDKVVAQDTGADHATLVVRTPKQGEKLLLLNGKEVEPRDEAIMIATRDKLIGIGGVMGGGDTEVDENTKNIILECANFDMYSIRRTSMANGIFTDAVTRFNKGQSPLQNVAVIARIAEDVAKLADGKLAGKLVDDNHLSAEIMESGALEAPVEVTRAFINARLGFDLTAQEIAELLANVEFGVAIHDDLLVVTAPFWRTDIAIPEDIVEEVGRLYGFDHLPLVLPKRDLTPVQKDPLVEFKAQLRQTLSRAGANEVLGYSFVHGKLLEKVGQEPANSFQLSNALSPDLQYYRTSLTPGLLEKVHPNIKAGYDEFALFEINKTHSKAQGEDAEGLPLETDMLSLVVAASDKKAAGKPGAAFYQARTYLDFLAHSLGLEFVYAPLSEEWLKLPGVKPYDTKRAATVTVKGEDNAFGIIGEFRPAVARSLKLPRFTAAFDLHIDRLLEARDSSAGHQYIALPKFPKVEQDICLRLPADVPYQDLADLVETTVSKAQPEQTLHNVSPLDIYQAKDDAEHKQVTFHVWLANYERTLTDEEANAVLGEVANAAAETYKAERV